MDVFHQKSFTCHTHPINVCCMNIKSHTLFTFFSMLHQLSYFGYAVVAIWKTRSTYVSVLHLCHKVNMIDFVSYNSVMLYGQKCHGMNKKCQYMKATDTSCAEHCKRLLILLKGVFTNFWMEAAIYHKGYPLTFFKWDETKLWKQYSYPNRMSSAAWVFSI